MRYHIALPLRDDQTGPARIDIVDPVWSPVSRALAADGLADFEVATNAVLLTLFERCPDGFSFVDVDAGIGVASSLCASLFPRGRVIAHEPDDRARAMFRRIASANGLATRVEPNIILDELIDSTCVIRIGAIDSAIGWVEQIVAASPDRPPVVIVGNEPDDERRDALATVAVGAGYRVLPLKRFPTWRPLTAETNPGTAGYLLFPGSIPGEVKDRHPLWAGALGACTPDHNDAVPHLAEIRSVIPTTRRPRTLVTAARLDLQRGARAAWRRVDPWLPPSHSRLGRLIDLGLRRARRWLDLRSATGPTR